MIRWVIALLIFSTTAFAVDRGQYKNVDPFLKEWVEGLKSKAAPYGCCAINEGIPNPATWSADGKYHVKIEGKWYDVPDDALITVPNKLGYAVVWYFKEDGKIMIRCFMPGTLT